MDSQQITTLTGVLDKKMNRQLKQYLDICARCAICKECLSPVRSHRRLHVPAGAAR